MAVDPNLNDVPGAARILICGDQPVIRTALRRLIESEPGMTVIGECGNQCCSLLEEAGTRPDLVLMDIDLDTRCSGALEQFEELLRAANGAPIVILTARDDSKSLQCALQHGASGFVMKDRPASILMRAIRAVLSGETWLERSTMAGMFRVEVAAPPAPRPPDKLTHREWEIVELIRLGMQNKRIAERLFISETTVRHHLTSIFDKLGVANRCELISYMFGQEHDIRAATAMGQR
jgi:DNA-binding NarL/FixJ family response regulator